MATLFWSRPNMPTCLVPAISMIASRTTILRCIPLRAALINLNGLRAGGCWPLLMLPILQLRAGLRWACRAATSLGTISI